jgi:hypothetical protein
LELRSQLLSSLLAEIDIGRRLTVLDIGPASPETVEFFSQFKCRIYFADLFAEDVLGEQNEETTVTEMQDRFSSLLDYPAECGFDICLLWDVLNYLDEPAVQGFTKALLPFLSATSKIHGFTTLKASINLPNQRYSIQQTGCLKVRAGKTQPDRYYPHSQLALNKMLYGMDVHKARLFTNGLLEILLEVNGRH